MCVTFTGIHRNSMTAQSFDGPDVKLDGKYKTRSLGGCLAQTHAHAAEQDT